MRKPSRSSALLAGLLLIGVGGSAGAQTAPESEDHHPKAASPSAGAGEAPAAAAPQGMPEGMMGMMTPEMMQMMQRMMAQGMMGQGGGMPGMMGQGGGMSGMMGQGMMGQGGGMPGMTGQRMKDGAGLLYGLPSSQQEEVTPEQVLLWLEQRLKRHGNPRLTLGEITADDDSITAEIVTVDGSLVQKLAFNRFPGLVRQLVE